MGIREKGPSSFPIPRLPPSLNSSSTLAARETGKLCVFINLYSIKRCYKSVPFVKRNVHTYISLVTRQESSLAREVTGDEFTSKQRIMWGWGGNESTFAQCKELGRCRYIG